MYYYCWTLTNICITVATQKPNILQKAGLFEGDIAIDLTDVKNAIRDESKLWPNGEVPFVISDNFNDDDRNIIYQAIKEYHSKTCIR